MAPNNHPRYSKSNSHCDWLTRIVYHEIVIYEIYQVFCLHVSCVMMADCKSRFDKAFDTSFEKALAEILKTFNSVEE